MYVLNIALALYVYLYLSELALLPLASRERKKGRPMWQSNVVVDQVRSQKGPNIQSLGHLLQCYTPNFETKFIWLSKVDTSIL